MVCALSCTSVACGASGARPSPGVRVATVALAGETVPASRTLPRVQVTAVTLRGADRIESSALSLLGGQLRHYQRGYVNGVWTDPGNPGCWACTDGGPMTGAAAAFVLGGARDQQLLREAVQSADTAIRTHQRRDGSFSDPSGESLPIGTAFFGTQLGMTDYLLRPYLSPATRLRWARSLAAATMFLVNDGSTSYYSNGNINLAYTQLAWLAWNATGSNALKRVFNASWSFTLTPPAGQFPGDGLVVTRPPSRADGADGSAFLAESNHSDAPGWDPCYGVTQLDVLAPLYAESHDPRVLRVMNLLLNQELTRVNTSSWVIDCSHGTRHTAAVDNEAFQTASLAAVSLLGGRTDLLADVLPELAAERSWYTGGAGQNDSLSFRRTFGNDIASIALAAAEVKLSAQHSASRDR